MLHGEKEKVEEGTTVAKVAKGRRMVAAAVAVTRQEEEEEEKKEMSTEERTQGGGSRGGGSLLLQNVLLEKSKLGSVVVKGMMVDRGGGFARAAAAWGDLASSEGVKTSSLENSSLTSSLLPLSHGNSSSSSSSSSSFTGSASITGVVGREREIGKGREIGSPYVQSPSSSMDLSSPSFKSSLRSSSSNYGSSQERESEGERERRGGEKTESRSAAQGTTTTHEEAEDEEMMMKKKLATMKKRSAAANHGDMGSVSKLTIDNGDKHTGEEQELVREDEHDEEERKKREINYGVCKQNSSSSGGGLSKEVVGQERAGDDKDSRGKKNLGESGRESGDKDYSSGGGNHHKLSSVSRASNGSDSSESSCSTLGYGGSKPHKANDKRWEGIQAIRVRDGSLGLSHFKLLKRLGCGDIGSVYLAELRGSHSHFAMKVMDKDSLARRKKLLRAQTEREILQSLDHPFLPTLYTHFESDKFLCLVMEFCSGGDLHTLRQRQPGKHFSEQAARFYAAEILLALEYLHMMGVVYRDLKPENVLVREDGHIMLSDFDLSLKCAVSPTLVKSSASDSHDGGRRAGIPVYCIQPVSCAEPSCVGGIQVPVPSCVGPVGALSCVSPCFVMKSSLPSLLPSFVRKKKDAKNAKAGGTVKAKSAKPKMEMGYPVTPLPELFAEPTDARSMSFVGTHEYLAPEIIKGDGHGSAVDWWTFGIFLYELLFGKTPFKGSGNRATLFNVVGQPLKFPESATGQVSFAARDLIRGLLVKEPLNRLASKRGAAEIKAHPFFEGVNWALIRCTSPPEVPRPFELGIPVSNSASPAEDVSASKGAKVASQDTPLSSSSSSTLSSSGHKLMSESRKTTGEKQGSSNNTRAAPTESSHSSGGSYVDFDFF